MKKKFALALAAALMVSLFAGCSKPAENPGSASGSTTSTSQTTTGETKKIGVCIYKFDDAFMTTYRNALQEILEGKVKAGDKVLLGVSKEEIKFSVKSEKALDK